MMHSGTFSRPVRAVVGYELGWLSLTSARLKIFQEWDWYEKTRLEILYISKKFRGRLSRNDPPIPYHLCRNQSLVIETDTQQT